MGLLLTVTQAGETLLNVPVSALRTVQTVPKSISKPLGNITVQGLLAAEFSLEDSEVRALWRAILPTKEDFTEIMPFMWHSSLQSLLPPAALILLENQKKKISIDWSTVSAVFPHISYSVYIYNWFIVSTRTFYYTSPKIKIKKPINRDDCLALSPFADLFNHADLGCEVTFSPYGYKISADRDIEMEEEIYISYGNHTNDFLLVEYGFILSENKWDEVSLDNILLPLFSEDQKKNLEDEGFLGKFVLDGETVCYRTQVALRLLCMPAKKWRALVANGLEEKDEYQMSVNETLRNALKLNLESVERQIERIEVLDLGLDSQRKALSTRWKQLHLLLTTSIDRMQSQGP